MDPPPEDLTNFNLTSDAYQKLSDEEKTYLRDRIGKDKLLFDAALIAELTQALAEELGDEKNTYLHPVITEQRDDIALNLANIALEYKAAGVDSSIADYYKIKYVGKAKDILTGALKVPRPADAPPVPQASSTPTPPQPASPPPTPFPPSPTPTAPSTTPSTTPATPSPTPPTPTPTPTQKPPPPTEAAPPASPSPQSTPPPSPSPPTPPPKPEESSPQERTRPAPVPPAGSPLRTRIQEIADALSAWEGRPTKEVLEGERELITKLIVLADKNADVGITQTHLLKAAESMVDDESHDARLHKETFDEKHLPELLKRAKGFVDGGS